MSSTNDTDNENTEETQSIGSAQAHDLSSLQENFSQQQAKISALKELVRQSEVDQGKNTASAQEKVRNIAQRLNHLKTKASRSRQGSATLSDKTFTEIQEEFVVETQTTIVTKQYEHESQLVDTTVQQLSASSSSLSVPQRARSETPGSEKIQLLRQQMEQNRQKMAERETNKRGIEQLVTQLKAKFDSSQLSLDRAHQLGSSVGDLSAIAGSVPHKHQSTGDLSGGFNLDRERIKYLEKRVRHLEAEAKAKEKEFLNRDPQSEHLKIIKSLEEKILDLEENLKEKDDVIQARTKAASLITESLSLKGKSTVELLEETKQEMFKMQTAFVQVEDELKAEIDRLTKECQVKDKKIANLEEVNDILETARFDLTMKNSELDGKSGTVDEYVIKLNELNKINETLQHRIETLENNQNQTDVTLVAQATVEQVRKVQELEAQITEIQRENDDLKKSLQNAINVTTTDEDIQDKIRSLEATITAHRKDCTEHTKTIEDLQEQLTEKTVEYNVLLASFNILEEKLKSHAPKSLFSKSTDEEAQAEINKLTKQLDEANKLGIKTKLKMKQLQKQVDTFKKASDTNKELIKQAEEIQRLNEKIKELESEKIAFVTSNDGQNEGEKTPQSSEMETKLKILETTCQNQTSAIQLLEEQKLDMTADLNSTRTELSSLKGHIKDIDKQELTSEMDSIVLEEQIDSYQREIDALKQQINQLTEDKNEINVKLERYINENMELLDKIEKLSKGSSAESIEILERLTHQEKLEMDEYQHALEIRQKQNRSQQSSVIEGEDDRHYASSIPSDDVDDAGGVALTSAALHSHNNEGEPISQNLSDSLVKLREESSELMDKIELFTAERREVLAKMEALREENANYCKIIDELRAEREQLKNDCEDLKTDNLTTIKQLKETEDERQHLLDNIKEISDIKTKLQAEIDAITKAKAEVAEHQHRHVSHPWADHETYRTSLKNLEAELTNYRNAKDKNSKFNVSKKLAKEAKNLSELVGQLLSDYERSAESFISLKAEVEGKRIAREEHDNQKLKEMAEGLVGDSSGEEVKRLEDELEKHKNAGEELKKRYAELEEQIALERQEKEQLKSSLNDATEKFDTSLKAENEHLNEQIRDLESKLSETSEFNFQELQKQRKEFDNLLETSQNEIQILRELVEEQKQQLISAYTEHEEELQEKANQISTYGEQVKKLQSELDETNALMVNANDQYMADLTKKIESMRLLLDENQKILDEQTKELSNKQETIETLNNQIMELYATMEHQAAELNEKDEEITRIQGIVDQNKAEIKKLHEKVQANERQNKELVQKKEDEFKSVRTELETKNKEQLEKLKKFAANLKKRNAQYTELEEKYKNLEKNKGGDIIAQIAEEPLQTKRETIGLQQSSNKGDAKELDHLKETISNLEGKLHQSDSEINKLQVEINHFNAELENIKLRLVEKLSVIDQLTNDLGVRNKEIAYLHENAEELGKIRNELNVTAEDLKSKNIKIEKCKAVIKEKNKEIKRLQEQVGKTADSSATTTDDLIRLRVERDEIESNFKAYKSSIEAKLQENALFIETIENENVQLKERIGRLEESISIAEERRSSLERHSELLGLQLQQKQSQIENAEDEFTYRVKALVGQDEIIEQKLKDLENERDGLLESLKESKDQLNEVTRKYTFLQSHVSELENNKMYELEEDNKTLKDKINRLEKQLLDQKEESDQQISAKQAELLELENELSIVMQKVEKERRCIQEDLEKSRDENTALQDELVRMRELQSGLEQSRTELEKEITWIKLQNDSMTHDQVENQGLRMQVVQDQTEVDNLRIQNREMAENHAMELKNMREQLSEAIQMKEKLLETNSELEKLQIEIRLLREQHITELDSLRNQICRDQTEIVNLRLKCEQLEDDHEVELVALRQQVNQNHNHDQLEVQQLRVQIGQDHQEIESLRLQKQQLDNELAVLRQQISDLDSMRMHVAQNVTQDQLEVQHLRTQINHDQAEIENLRHQLLQLNSSHESELAGLRQQISELDSLRMQVGQNQTDDQVFIQNENERLQALLAEKEIEIQNYQRQNLQLQMSANIDATASVNVPHDPFAIVNDNPFISNELHEGSSLRTEIANLQNQLSYVTQELSEKQVKINDLELNLAAYSGEETNDLHSRLTELQRLCNEKDAEIARLQDQSTSHPPQIENPVFNIENFVTGQHVQHSNTPLSSPLSSFFDNPNPSPDIGINVAAPSVEHHDQQIEDLQRNVSDLEKYVTDLEHKLKSATEDNIKYQNERVNLENNLAIKIRQYEEKISALEIELNKVKEKLVQNEAERMIVKSHADVVIPGTQQPANTASIFFGPATTSDPFDQVISSTPATSEDGERRPVVEETIIPKKAYILHPNDELEALDRQNLSPFSGNQSEGWGDNSWGADAALEEEHQRSIMPLAIVSNAEVKLQHQIDDLNAERDQLKEELTSIHAKYTKMLKKLKEYKKKNDQFEHSKKASAFEQNDLDLAIQEELNNRIKTLEQSVKETKGELEKETQEKKKLFSRIDVLTAANERMCEMKEKQDIEIEVCKTKVRELTNKLEKLNEWGDDGAVETESNKESLSIRLVEVQNQNRLLEERIARLQESVTDKDDFEEEREQLLEKIRVLSVEKTLLEESIAMKDEEISALKTQISVFQNQSNDYSSTIDLLSGESNNIKEYLDQLKDDHKQKIDENTNLSENLKELDHKNNELSKQVEEMRLYNLSTQDTEQRIQDLLASNQYKDSEIAMLNERIETEKTNIDQEWTRLNEQLSSNKETIAKLQQEIAKLTAEKEALVESTVHSTEVQNISTTSTAELENLIAELREEKANMEHELQVLNDQVLKNLEMEDRTKSTVLELDMKNIEISALKSSLEQLRSNQSQTSDSTVSELSQKFQTLEKELLDKETLHQTNVDQLNLNWQQALDERCHELADSWREHYARRQEEFDLVEKNLQHQISNLQSQLAQQDKNDATPGITESLSLEPAKPADVSSYPPVAEGSEEGQTAMLAKMQAALESQEIEIVSLKEQLAIRSAEYARLAASVDPYGQRSTSTSFQSLQTDKSIPQADGNKLDLALYMLHQRDMRCEELTEEVIHLLEERDTLQLKLSNSIRQIEDIKRRSGATEVPSEVDSNSSGSPTKPISDTPDDTFHDESTENIKMPNLNNLNLKLSELHKVGHSRDKTLYEEREQRRRQMSLLERDVAHMPPEAIAELFGPNYSPSSHSSQNQSSMLLNWLWGKGSTNEADN